MYDSSHFDATRWLPHLCIRRCHSHLLTRVVCWCCCLCFVFIVSAQVGIKHARFMVKIGATTPSASNLRILTSTSCRAGRPLLEMSTRHFRRLFARCGPRYAVILAHAHVLCCRCSVISLWTAVSSLSLAVSSVCVCVCVCDFVSEHAGV